MPDDPSPLDHTGWRLHLAARAWMDLFSRRMVARGYPVLAEARAVLLPHIGPRGTDQRTLAARSGLTKQAVQQHLDGLCADGLFRRLPVEGDGRRWRVEVTPMGQALYATADEVKRRIDAQLAAALGATALGELHQRLGALAEIVNSLDDPSA